MNKVTSYFQQELEDVIISAEALDEWNELASELGLKQPDAPAAGKSPNPFLFMTPSMVATFETLCPREVKLEEYTAAPIPLEALRLIKLAVQEGHFERIMIRYDDKGPDPVAIGERGNWHAYAPSWRRLTAEEAKDPAITQKYFTTAERFLIARWGAESASLEKLAKMAKERHIREQKAEKTKQIKNLQNELNTLEEEATIKFNC